ncbi:MAG TPA: LysM peptidoglycan-binding domain-containing protein [Acidimicrobiia bacterium]
MPDQRMPRHRMQGRRRVRAVAAGVTLAVVTTVFSLDYTVQRGDTLWQIAHDNGVTVADMAKTNGIENPDLIFPGQVLVIPGKETAKATPPKEVVHVVQAGETLAKIASKYGSTASAIAKANDIRNVNLIRPGQKLVIPGIAASGGTTDSAVRTDRYHVVKSGETLASIASKSGVSPDQIARANGIVDGIIYTGTRLFLDGPVYKWKGESKRTYTVKSGDRLASIAEAHKTTVDSIVRLNNLSNPNLIKVGQQLIINTAGWVCPLDSSTFFNDWGFPRGGGRYHEGNDMFAKRGTPVRAPVSGTVKQVVGKIGGNQVNLHGDDGVMYLASHLDKFGKSGRVAAGDVIGYVGNTGNAAGASPHLHFGMYMHGVVINPYPTLLEHGCR